MNNCYQQYGNNYDQNQNGYMNGQQQQQQQYQQQNVGQQYQQPPEEVPLANGGKSQYSLSLQDIQNDQARCSNSNQMSVTSFDDLPNYPPNTDLNTVAAKVLECFKNGDWKQQYDALDNLRVFNKYYYSNINAIFQQYGQYISQTIESPKTQLTKQCLLLISEIFFMQSIQPDVALNILFTETFVPLLLKYATNVHTDIKNTAQQALIEFQKNMFLKEESIIAACQGCFNKTPQVQIYALKLLGSIIQLLDVRFTKLNEVTLQKIMKTLAEMLGGKQKANVSSEAINICLIIGGIIGEENYINLMQVCLSVDEQKNMQREIMEDNAKKTKKKEKQSRVSLTQYLKSCPKQKFQANDQFVLTEKQQNVYSQIEQQRQAQQQYTNNNQNNVQFGGQYNQNLLNIQGNGNFYGNMQQCNSQGFSNNNVNNQTYNYNSNSNGF